MVSPLRRPTPSLRRKSAPGKIHGEGSGVIARSRTGGSVGITRHPHRKGHADRAIGFYQGFIFGTTERGATQVKRVIAPVIICINSQLKRNSSGAASLRNDDSGLAAGGTRGGDAVNFDLRGGRRAAGKLNSVLPGAEAGGEGESGMSAVLFSGTTTSILLDAAISVQFAVKIHGGRVRRCACRQQHAGHHDCQYIFYHYHRVSFVIFSGCGCLQAGTVIRS